MGPMRFKFVAGEQMAEKVISVIKISFMKLRCIWGKILQYLLEQKKSIENSENQQEKTIINEKI